MVLSQEYGKKMKIESTLLSIVIPTHNRSHYAIHSINSILKFDLVGLEIVVSDTSNNDNLKVLISEIDLSLTKVKLKYIKHDVRLDMTENHNYAMSLATGKYVCLIGDDDSISAELYDAAVWADQHDIGIITPIVSATYNWPDFVTKVYGKKHCTRLYLPSKVGGFIKRDSKLALSNALKRAFQGTDGLPKLYHGLVKRDLLEELCKRTGAYFHGSSPDMSAAIGLALISDHFYELDYPLTIPGASGGSNTGRSALNKHKGSIENESQTNSFVNSGWNNMIPKFFSVETVWSHAGLVTMEKIRPKLIDEFNFYNLYALCESKHSEFIFEINSSKLNFSKNYNENRFGLKLEIAKYKFFNYMYRFSYIAKRIMNPSAAGGKVYYSDVQDVSRTPELLLEHLKKKNYSLFSILTKSVL